MLRISLSMVDTSCRRGTLCSVTVSAVSRAAHSSGSAAFFAPEISTVPANDLSPLMSSLSMSFFLLLVRVVAVVGPFGRRVGFHRERMHLVGLHAAAQRGIHLLVA